MALNTTCGNFSCNGTDNNSQFVDIEKLLSDSLGERRRDLPSAVVLTFVYSLVFITGTIGNICTCVVIAKNSYMHTTTNYYLFSLAVSDLLMLLSCKYRPFYKIHRTSTEKKNLVVVLVEPFKYVVKSSKIAPQSPQYRELILNLGFHQGRAITTFS